MKQFIFGVVVTLAAALVILNVHFVIYNGGVTAALKNKMSLDKTIVDARNLNPLTFAKLPGPVRSVLAEKGIKKVKGKIGDGIDRVKKQAAEY